MRAMASTNEFDMELFERRLHTLKDSQESIQSLSAWCLERRQHHKKIVATWLQVLKKVKVEHRLTLFYLANDVIQYSKRKNFEFVESWGTTLQRATTMVRDEKVKHRVLRIFKIWDQRQVYDEEFLADLSGLISAAPKKKVEPPPPCAPEEFQSPLLISTMRSCATLEQATDARLRDLRESNVDIENAEELCSSLKDRRRVEDTEKEVELAVRNVENYVRALEAEIRERTQVLELLEQADQFYETQRGEVKIVTNAYRNFGSRVKNLKKKLDELLPTFVSPIPSPDVNAPSPSPDSDIDLPGDENQAINRSTIIEVAPPSLYGSYSRDYEALPTVSASELAQGNDSGDFTNNFASFIGGSMDFANMRSLFNERSVTPTRQYNDSLEAKPIEVINTRPKNENTEDFNISSFLKNVLPNSDSTGDPNGGIPGLGLDVPDAQIGSPQRSSYDRSPALGQLTSVTPVVSRMMNNQQGVSSVPLNNCPMNHSTPLPVRNLSTESHTPSPYSSQNSQSNVPFDGSTTSNVVNPLPPPPLPPPIFLDEENCYNKLPPKFPTWAPNESVKEAVKWEEKGDFVIPSGKSSMNPTWPCDNDDKNKAAWIDRANDRWDPSNESTWPNTLGGKNEILSETPESPPMYEKTGFRDPVEYDESQTQEPLLSAAGDVDHRVIPIPLTADNQLSYRLMKSADVDHRNLISLTGSPANHNNGSDSSLSMPNNNNLWSTSDQDYRRHVQPGDIVESVDMEMSDEETDSKQKSRVLVDVRSQDRDMRVPMPSQVTSLDMDMRMIPLPSGQMPAPCNQTTIPDVHAVHAGPPPLPPPQFHQAQSNFRQSPSDFRHPHRLEFHPNHQSFHSGQQQQQQQQPPPPPPPPPPPNFLQNQEFHGQAQQDFRPLHQGQPEFHQNQQQDFEFRDNQHGVRASQEFLNDSQIRGRFPPLSDHHRESATFHRNDRGGRAGRGFSKNRRDRYSDDHGVVQRTSNNRKSRTLDQQQQQQQQPQRSSPDALPNSHKSLLMPPDTVVILDENAIPISMPEGNESCQDMSSQKSRVSLDLSVSRDLSQSDRQPYQPMEIRLNSDLEHCQKSEKRVSHLLEPDHEERGTLPQDSHNAEKNILGNPEVDENVRMVEERGNFDEAPRQLSEQLEALMGGTWQSNKDVKRQAANGSVENSEDEGSPCKKRVLLPNGPPTSLSSDPHGMGGPDLHPAVAFDYESQNVCASFRPRLAGPLHFPSWRGALPRARAGFRGAPRIPWMDSRGIRGPPPPPPPPPVGAFMPRGLKRGQFRGGGVFRGRGRANNW